MDYYLRITAVLVCFSFIFIVSSTGQNVARIDFQRRNHKDKTGEVTAGHLAKEVNTPVSEISSREPYNRELFDGTTKVQNTMDKRELQNNVHSIAAIIDENLSLKSTGFGARIKKLPPPVSNPENGIFSNGRNVTSLSLHSRPKEYSRSTSKKPSSIVSFRSSLKPKPNQHKTVSISKEDPQPEKSVQYNIRSPENESPIFASRRTTTKSRRFRKPGSSGNLTRVHSNENTEIQDVTNVTEPSVISNAEQNQEQSVEIPEDAESFRQSQSLPTEGKTISEHGHTRLSNNGSIHSSLFSSRRTIAKSRRFGKPDNSRNLPQVHSMVKPELQDIDDVKEPSAGIASIEVKEKPTEFPIAIVSFRPPPSPLSSLTTEDSTSSENEHTRLPKNESISIVSALRTTAKSRRLRKPGSSKYLQVHRSESPELHNTNNRGDPALITTQRTKKTKNQPTQLPTTEPFRSPQTHISSPTTDDKDVSEHDGQLEKSDEYVNSRFSPSGKDYNPVSTIVPIDQTFYEPRRIRKPNESKPLSKVNITRSRNFQNRNNVRTPSGNINSKQETKQPIKDPLTFVPFRSQSHILSPVTETKVENNEQDIYEKSYTNTRYSSKGKNKFTSESPLVSISQATNKRRTTIPSVPSHFSPKHGSSTQEYRNNEQDIRNEESNEYANIQTPSEKGKELTRNSFISSSNKASHKRRTTPSVFSPFSQKHDSNYKEYTKTGQEESNKDSNIQPPSENGKELTRNSFLSSSNKASHKRRTTPSVFRPFSQKHNSNYQEYTKTGQEESNKDSNIQPPSENGKELTRNSFLSSSNKASHKRRTTPSVFRPFTQKHNSNYQEYTKTGQEESNKYLNTQLPSEEIEELTRDSSSLTPNNEASHTTGQRDSSHFSQKYGSSSQESKSNEQSIQREESNKYSNTRPLSERMKELTWDSSFSSSNKASHRRRTSKPSLKSNFPQEHDFSYQEYRNNTRTQSDFSIKERGNEQSIDVPKQEYSFRSSQVPLSTKTSDTEDQEFRKFTQYENGRSPSKTFKDEHIRSSPTHLPAKVFEPVRITKSKDDGYLPKTDMPINRKLKNNYTIRTPVQVKKHHDDSYAPSEIPAPVVLLRNAPDHVTFPLSDEAYTEEETVDKSSMELLSEPVSNLQLFSDGQVYNSYPNNKGHTIEPSSEFENAGQLVNIYNYPRYKAEVNRMDVWNERPISQGNSKSFSVPHNLASFKNTSSQLNKEIQAKNQQIFTENPSLVTKTTSRFDSPNANPGDRHINTLSPILRHVSNLSLASQIKFLHNSLNHKNVEVLSASKTNRVPSQSVPLPSVPTAQPAYIKYFKPTVQDRSRSPSRSKSFISSPMSTIFDSSTENGQYYHYVMNMGRKSEVNPHKRTPTTLHSTGNGLFKILNETRINLQPNSQTISESAPHNVSKAEMQTSTDSLISPPKNPTQFYKNQPGSFKVNTPGVTNSSQLLEYLPEKMQINEMNLTMEKNIVAPNVSHELKSSIATDNIVSTPKQISFLLKEILTTETIPELTTVSTIEDIFDLTVDNNASLIQDSNFEKKETIQLSRDIKKEVTPLYITTDQAPLITLLVSKNLLITNIPEQDKENVTTSDIVNSSPRNVINKPNFIPESTISVTASYSETTPNPVITNAHNVTMIPIRDSSNLLTILAMTVNNSEKYITPESENLTAVNIDLKSTESVSSTAYISTAESFSSTTEYFNVSDAVTDSPVSFTTVSSFIAEISSNFTAHDTTASEISDSSDSVTNTIEETVAISNPVPQNEFQNSSIGSTIIVGNVPMLEILIERTEMKDFMSRINNMPIIIRVLNPMNQSVQQFQTKSEILVASNENLEDRSENGAVPISHGTTKSLSDTFYENTMSKSAEALQENTAPFENTEANTFLNEVGEAVFSDDAELKNSTLSMDTSNITVNTLVKDAFTVPRVRVITKEDDIQRHPPRLQEKVNHKYYDTLPDLEQSFQMNSELEFEMHDPLADNPQFSSTTPDTSNIPYPIFRTENHKNMEDNIQKLMQFSSTTPDTSDIPYPIIRTEQYEGMEDNIQKLIQFSSTNPDTSGIAYPIFRTEKHENMEDNISKLKKLSSTTQDTSDVLYPIFRTEKQESSEDSIQKLIHQMVSYNPKEPITYGVENPKHLPSLTDSNVNVERKQPEESIHLIPIFYEDESRPEENVMAQIMVDDFDSRVPTDARFRHKIPEQPPVSNKSTAHGDTSKNYHSSIQPEKYTDSTYFTDYESSSSDLNAEGSEIYPETVIFKDNYFRSLRRNYESDNFDSKVPSPLIFRYNNLSMPTAPLNYSTTISTHGTISNGYHRNSPQSEQPLDLKFVTGYESSSDFNAEEYTLTPKTDIFSNYVSPNRNYYEKPKEHSLLEPNDNFRIVQSSHDMLPHFEKGSEDPQIPEDALPWYRARSQYYNSLGTETRPPTKFQVQSTVLHTLSSEDMNEQTDF